MGASRGGQHLATGWAVWVWGLGAGCHTRAVPLAGCSWGLAAVQPRCVIIHRPAFIPSTPPTLSSLYSVHNSSQNWPHKPCSLTTIPWSCGACFMASLGGVTLSGLVKERKKRGLLVFGKPSLQLLLMSFCSGEDRCGGNAVCLHKVRALCFNIWKWSVDVEKLAGWVKENALNHLILKGEKKLMLAKKCREENTGK